jgi:dolichyl-phosphate beta-glucosyltransferase
MASNRAFDTSKLGVGYGFENFPTKRVEMPPIWAIFVGLGFLVGALLFWVSFHHEGEQMARC